MTRKIDMSTLNDGGWKPSAVLVFAAIYLLLMFPRAEGQSLMFAHHGTTLSVRNGGDAVFECLLIDRPVAGAQFSWTGPALSNNHEGCSIDNRETTSSLMITNVMPGEEGMYQCSYTGLQTISTTLSVLIDPDFLDVPEHQKFAEGTDAVVKCPVFLPDESTDEMHWLRNSRFFSGERFTEEIGKLTIRNIHMNDSGSDYECQIHQSGSMLKSKLITVEVVPQHKLAPRINDSRRTIEVNYGDDLYLSCQLEEPQDDVVYFWTIDTALEHNIVKNSHGNVYRQAYQYLGGIYTCKAENQYGYDIVDFNVQILAAPLPSTCSQLVKANIGTTVVLKYCDLTSPVELSDLSIEWNKRNERGEFVGVSLGERISINHNGWLTIKDLESADFRVYRVNISNEIGYSIQTVQLELPSSTIATTQSASEAQEQVGAVPISLKINVHGKSITCNDVKEEYQDLIKKHLLGEFDVSDVALEGVVITCSLNSAKAGTFTVNLRGSGAGQLAILLRERATSVVTLSNGRTLTLTVCTNECSVETAESTKPISNAAGVIIAATFICVVLAGAVLLIVIVMRYRRRSLEKVPDEEKVIPSRSVKAAQIDNAVREKTEHSKLLQNKPRYGRSISLTLPSTSS